MRYAVLASLLLLAPGCAGLQSSGAGKALAFASCAFEDERLRVAVEDPEAARAYLAELRAALDHAAKEIKAGRLPSEDELAKLRDAADLAARLAECIGEARRI